MSWRFYSRVPTRNAALRWPNLEDLGAQDVGEKREWEENINGLTYHIVELNKALFPAQAQTIQIPASQLQLDIIVKEQQRPSPFQFFNHSFDDFFDHGQTIHQVVETPAQTLQVKPLPTVPSEFGDFDGAVGHFQLTSENPRKTVRVGDSITQTIAIHGSSADARLVPIEATESWQVFEENPTITTTVEQNRLLFTQVIHRAFVPIQSGELKLPPPRLVFFDPKKQLYQAINAAAAVLTVNPATNQTSSQPSSQIPPTAVPNVSASPQPQPSQLSKLSPQLMVPIRLPPLWLAKLLLWLCPGLVGLVLAIGYSRVFFAYLGGQRWQRRKLKRHIRQQLRQAANLQALGRHVEAAKLCITTIRMLVNVLWQCDSQQLTPFETKKLIVNHTQNNELAQRLEHIFSECESIIYGRKQHNLAIDTLMQVTLALSAHYP